MKAYQITKPGTIVKTEMSEMPAAEDRVKIKMTRAGISILDSRIYEGRLPNVAYPIVPVRHGVGIVSETGEQSPFQRGTRVVIDPYYVCGKCYNCSTGNSKLCENIQSYGRDRHGFLREFALVPNDSVYELPDHVKDNEAIFVEHISTAISVINQLGVKQGEYLAIIGASVVGTILAQVAMYYQAIPILIDNFDDKLDTAKQLGIYYTVNPSRDDPVKKIAELTGGRMAECVAYMSNSNEKIQRALDCASYGGRISLVGWEIVDEILSANISATLNKKLTIYGMQASRKYIAQGINLIASKSVNVNYLISGEIKFDDVPEYFEKMRENPYIFHKFVVTI